MSAKRKLGGHFGSAVGASTNTKRAAASWREEVDAVDGPPPLAVGSAAAAAADDSDSEVPVDPGTPLPSEDEAEPAATNGSAVEPAAADEAAVAAEVSANGAATVAPAAADVRLAADEPARQLPMVASLELLVGEVVMATLQVLLTDGFDQAMARRLKACASPAGGAVEALAAGAFCAFGGYASPPPLPTPAAKVRAARAAVAASAPNGTTPHKGEEADAARAAPPCQHHCAGLLSVPREGDVGLLLTLGPMPHLDATHRVLGSVVAGRGALRRLEALAALSGDALDKPSVPRQVVAIRAGGPGEAEAGTGKGAAPAAGGSAPAPAAPGSGPLVEPAAECEGADTKVFAREKAYSDEKEDAFALAEELDIAELELAGRDLEVSDLNQQAFSRERQGGVIAVKTALLAVQERLKDLEGGDEALAGQSMWLQERASHLLRIIEKLH